MLEDEVPLGEASWLLMGVRKCYPEWISDSFRLEATEEIDLVLDLDLSPGWILLEPDLSWTLLLLLIDLGPAFWGFGLVDV